MKFIYNKHKNNIITMNIDFNDFDFDDLGFVDKKAGKRIMKYINSKKLENENLEFDNMVDRYKKPKKGIKINIKDLIRDKIIDLIKSIESKIN